MYIKGVWKQFQVHVYSCICRLEENEAYFFQFIKIWHRKRAPFYYQFITTLR